MKVPKRISTLLKRKQDFIDRYRSMLENSVIKLQSKLLDEYIAQIIPSLNVKDGAIMDTEHNYRLLSELDKTYKEFTKMSASLISSQVVQGAAGIVDLNKQYFKLVLNTDLGATFQKIIEETARRIDLRIGVAGGDMVRGGFLDSFLKDPALSTQIKSYVSKSIAGQTTMKEFVTGLSEVINGDKGPGALEKQFERYAYDIYQQYDRAYSNSLADEFEMNYFVYQGGLIDDSRDFCAAHNNKVWTREEAKEWPEWTPSKGEYPTGYEVKQKDPYKVPSYLGYAGYQPLIDAGGYNCRHAIGWISDELAFELRPDLKG